MIKVLVDVFPLVPPASGGRGLSRVAGDVECAGSRST